MKNVICNYAPIRFMPYRDLGELVNVGIVLVCPQLNYFQYKIEQRRHKRVHDFFPELDMPMYHAALLGLENELRYASEQFETKLQSQFVFDDVWKKANFTFTELVRPSESLINFGSVATAISDDPERTLEDAFARFVTRQFAQTREQQEVVMQRVLQRYLTEHGQHFARNVRLGNDNYHVQIPFARYGDDREHVAIAIKPMSLDRQDTTQIYERGDAWVSRIKRLRNINELPEHFLIAIREPRSGQDKIHACAEVRHQLEDTGIQTLDFGDRQGIVGFAKQTGISS